MPGQLCDWAKDSCGAPTDPPDHPFCADAPSSCGDALVCGCDGTIYEGTCAAFDAGVDIDASNACETPAGLFPCGAHFCTSLEEWCLAHVVDITGVPDEYDCKPLPPECNGVPTCDCVTGADECVEWSCDELDSGDVRISC
jgi:hypothetical protein